MNRHHYDNEVHPDNVYGHTLELLRRHVPSAAAGEPSSVHLDVACGFGNIAEHIRDEFGLQYVGLDYDVDELEALASRGMETHRVDLMSPSLPERLAEVVGNRRIQSVTFLDGLEHLPDGRGALAALASLLHEHDAVLITSVPNVTHLDVVTKALLGQWDYTPSGLLDRTHYQLWSAGSLRSSFQAAGLDVIDDYDVELEHSDQHFPSDHLALSSASSIGSWLAELRDKVAPHRFTNQFVWASRANGRPAPANALDPRPATADQDAPTHTDQASSSPAPFMSVLVRTDGQRLEALDETLLSLAAQTVTDFEVIVLAQATGADLEALRSSLDEHPPTLRHRMVVVSASGTAAQVLNAGLSAARGTYVAFSDDVTWLGNWIESVQEHAQIYPSRCVRGVVLHQDVTSVSVGDSAGLRADSAPVRAGGVTFSLLEHVSAPLASTYGLAFPRSLFVDLGVKIEESWGSVALRSHLLRAVELAGVIEIGEIVAIHQRHDGTPTEDVHDLARLVDDIDARPYLVPTGGARRAIEGSLPIAEKLEEAREAVATLNQLTEMKDAHIGNLEAMLATRDGDLEQLRERLQKREEQVARLRQKLKARRGSAEEGSVDTPQRSGRFRLKR